jgi:hypothetical protein
MVDISSRTPIKIIVDGVGEAQGEFIKILAPLTVGAILKKLPMSGRLHPTPGGHSLIVGIRRGVEKAVTSVKAGTIAYWPMQDSLVLFNSDARPYSPVNKVGALTENLELLEKLKSGSRIRIERKK